MAASQKGAHIKDIDVAVCTIERANALLNVMMFQASDGGGANGTGGVFMTPSLRLLASVVVDEVHLLGDPARCSTCCNSECA